MSKPDPRSFIVSGTVYPFDVIFSIDETDDDLKTLLNDILPKGTSTKLAMNINESCNGRAVRLSSGQYVVRLKRADLQLPVFHGVVAHEIFHVTTFMMDHIGVPHDVLKTEEAYAYLNGYLTQEFYRNYLRIGDKE